MRFETFKLYDAVLADLVALKGEVLPLRKFRQMMCSRHQCPRRDLKGMERDLVDWGIIQRNRKTISVTWPYSTLFRQKGPLTQPRLFKPI